MTRKTKGGHKSAYSSAAQIVLESGPEAQLSTEQLVLAHAGD